MGRYVPGKIWMIIGRIHLSAKEGVPVLESTCSIYIETATLLIATLMLSYVAMQEYALGSVNSSYLTIAGIIFLISLLHPIVLERIINIGLRILKKPRISVNVSFLTVLKFVVFYLISWQVSGLALYFLVASLHNVGTPNVPIYSGIIATAWFVGLISIFAPSGLGVREGVMAYLLGHMIPIPIAVAVSFLSRFLCTVAEVGIVGFSFVLTNVASSKS